MLLKSALSPANILVWTAPPEQRFKVNCDASWDSDYSTGIGVIVRDNMGAFINGTSYNTISTSVIEAEGSAVIAGIRFALDKNISNVVVETELPGIGSLIEWP